MNDKNNEFVNIEEPIEVSEKELKMLMEASAQIDRGGREGLVSHEESLLYIDNIQKELDSTQQQKRLLKFGS